MPGANRAQVDDRKLAEYLLSPEHPTGRLKAAYFGSLGFHAGTQNLLKVALLRHAVECDVSSFTETAFGAKFILDGPLSGPNGSYSEIRSVWFVRRSDGQLRFVTAYPLKRRLK